MKKAFKVVGVVAGVISAIAGAGAVAYKKYEDLKKTAKTVAVDFVAENNNLPIESLVEVDTVFQPKTQTFVVEVFNAQDNKSHWIQLKLNLKKEVVHIVEFDRNVKKESKTIEISGDFEEEKKEKEE